MRDDSRYDRTITQFGEVVPFGFVDALSNPTAWTPRGYARLTTTFHALRAAVAGLRSAPRTDPLRAFVTTHFGAATSTDSVDARLDAQLWPACAERLEKDVWHNAAANVLVERLEQLAEAFRADGHFALGADVYLALVSSATHVETNDWISWLRGAASMTLGAGSEPRALVLLDWLRAAAAAGSDQAQCAALTVESQVHYRRGNLPRAESAARAAVDAAHAARDANGLSRAQYGLGIALGTQNRHDEAAVAFFDAYRAAAGDDFTRWSLTGLAHALLCLGRDCSAEDGCRLLLGMTLSVAQRIAVLNTLLCVAARRGDRALFDETRSAIEIKFAAQQLEPQLETMAYLSIGAGLWRFGESSRARDAWTRGLQVAEANHLNRQTIELEQTLHDDRPPHELLGPEPLPAIGDDKRQSASSRDVEYVETALRIDCERAELASIGR